MPHHMTAALAHLPKVERGETMADEPVRKSTITCKVKFEGVPLTEEQQGIVEKAIFESLQTRIKGSTENGGLVVDIDHTDVFNDIFRSGKLGKVDIDIERQPEIKSINEGTVWFVVKAKSIAQHYVQKAMHEVWYEVLHNEIHAHLKTPEIEKKLREKIAEQLTEKLSKILEQDANAFKIEFAEQDPKDPFAMNITLKSTIPAVQAIFDEIDKNGV